MENNVYNLVVFGCVSGKSTLIDRFVTGTFEITRDPTLEDSYMKKAVVDGEECVLNISDTSGIEEFSAMRKQYVLNGDGFLLVFSVNDRASFDYLIQKFLKLVEDKPVVLIGNKYHSGDREIDVDVARSFARSHNIPYIETAAHSGEGVTAAFYTLVRLIRRQKEIKKIGEKASKDRSDKHLAAVKWAMEKKGHLHHTIVHGVFTGLARSGKNSIMERLLGRMPSVTSPSTGVAEDVVQVKVEKSSTVATNIEASTWSAMEGDDEAIKLMQLSSNSQFISVGEHEHRSPATPQGTGSRIINMIKKKVVRKKAENPMKIFEKVVQDKDIGFTTLLQHLQKSWSLYLTNTGGQIEFQEVLPLLVSGPSIFFYVFRLDRDFNHRYQIEYDHPNKTSAKPYVSAFTTIEAILHTLATIASMGTFVYKGLQEHDIPLKPKVFFIGTHKDKLDSASADSHIAKVDKQLREVIESTSHYEDLVEFASPNHLLFAVDNFSQSESDFQSIRLAFERVIERDQFEMTSPVHWLIYSLSLRKLEGDVVSYDHCFEVAKRCGITTREELNEALHFIHSKMGLIRYFPHDSVKDVVVIKPQFLFDKVTDLIVDTFTFEKAGTQQMKSFREKGIFSVSKFEKISSRKPSGLILTATQFGDLMEHLRIVAPFYEGNKKKYFVPCALAHIAEKNAVQLHTSIPHILVAFGTGYCPKGLAGALIKYLMVNEMESTTPWSLKTNGIYRNEVSFNVGPYDTVILSIVPTHFIVTCIPDPQFTERTNWPVENTCTEVIRAIESGIKQILTDFSYIETQHHLTFPCTITDCANQGHPAELLYSGSQPTALLCNKTEKRCNLPSNYHIWGLRRPRSTSQQATSQQSVSPTLGHNSAASELLPAHSSAVNTASSTDPMCHEGPVLLDQTVAAANTSQSSPASSSHLPHIVEYASISSSEVPQDLSDTSRPTAANLAVIRWKNQGETKKFRLGKSIIHKWRTIGDLVVPRQQLEVWARRRDDEESCRAVISYWLDHPPRHYPATWEGLYELLDDSELGQVATELKLAVDNAI